MASDGWVEATGLAYQLLTYQEPKSTIVAQISETPGTDSFFAAVYDLRTGTMGEFTSFTTVEEAKDWCLVEIVKHRILS